MQMHHRDSHIAKGRNEASAQNRATLMLYTPPKVVQ